MLDLLVYEHHERLDGIDDHCEDRNDKDGLVVFLVIEVAIEEGFEGRDEEDG